MKYLNMFTAECHYGSNRPHTGSHTTNVGTTFTSCQITNLNPCQTFLMYNAVIFLFAAVCPICGSFSAWWQCKYCIGEFTYMYKTFQHSIPFCRDCIKNVHEHPDRSSHKYEKSVDADGKLDLLSVICIETSHYVCFTRAEDQWILFDSMANRVCKYWLI